jgi:hypothetical protein
VVGEAKRKKSATQKFIKEYPTCCFCGGARLATTREHMPPKAMFDGSHRPDKLVMPACDQCNRGTSTADLTAAIIGRWGYLLSETEHADHWRLVRQIRNPLTIRQLNQFAYKFVLTLYFEHFRRILPEDGRVSGFWRTKEDFGRAGIPQELLSMMRRYGTLEQGQWNTKEVFEYRYVLNETGGLFACLGRFRGNLFVTGFAAHDGKLLVEDKDKYWVSPSHLLLIPSDPMFDGRP